MHIHTYIHTHTHTHTHIHTYIHTKPTATSASIDPVEAGESKLAYRVIHTPSESEYLPASQAVQAASAAEIAPCMPYLPAAHILPIHVDAELAPAGAAVSVTCEVRGGTLSRDACARKQPYMSDG